MDPTDTTIAKTTSMVELLSTYIPIDRRQAMVAGVALPNRMTGAALFADISGFTPLTEAIDRDYGARRGGEELTRILNRVYGALIGQVHHYGGSVIGFSGDAITCWFDGDDGYRAATCALQLQQALAEFQAIATPSGATFALSLKVAVTAGRLRRLLVGDIEVQVIDVLAGNVLDRMAHAESLAQPGQVVVGAEVIAALAKRDQGATNAEATTTWITPPSDGKPPELAAGEPSLSEPSLTHAQRFAILHQLAPGAPPRPWPTPALHASHAEAMRPWVLPSVYHRLRSGAGDFLAELRPAVALFLRFQGLDFSLDHTGANAKEKDDVDAQLTSYIQWIQGVLHRYGGSLVQLTTGDKGSYLYAVFGAPIAHENAGGLALAAALLLSKPPEAFSFITDTRIGISRGRMRTGAYGGEGRRTYGALGDETNVAARLMSLAQPGQILVTPRLRKEYQASYEFSALGEMAIKGKSAPLSLYALSGRTGRPAQRKRRQRRDSMIGRSAERAALEQWLDALCGSGTGGAIVIEGEAGIGKTRLMNAFVDYARNKTAPTVRCLTSGADALERDTPLFVWRSVFVQLLGIAEMHDQEAARARVLAQLPKHLTSLAPLVEEVLDVDMSDLPDVAEDPRIQGNLRATWVPRFLSELFCTLVADQPVVLAIEDGHWMDSSSWTLLDRIQRDLPTLLVVLSSRPMDVPSDGYRRCIHSERTQLHKLDALQADDVIALVCRRLGVEALPDPVSTLIQDKAEGNPFFSEELAYALRDAELIRIEGHTCVATRELSDLDIPDTIEGVVTSRIDRLTPSQQLALKVASVLGRAFLLSTLRDVFPVAGDRHCLPTWMQQLANLDLTPLEAADPHPSYFFKHAITQEVAYNMMLFEQRRALHRLVAEWYERIYADDLSPFYSLMAYHRWKVIEGAQDPHLGDIEHAVTALRRAGKRALESGATPEALQHLRRGLELLQSLPPSQERDLIEVEMRFHCGTALMVVCGPTHEEVGRELERGRELCHQLGQLSRLFEAIFATWYFHFIQSDRDGTVAYSEQLIQLARRADQPALQFMAYAAYGSTMICAGSYAGGLEQMRQALAIARRAEAAMGSGSARGAGALSMTRDPVSMAYAYCAWANWFLGYPDQSLRDVETAIGIAREVAHPLTLVQALSFGALVARYRRDVASSAQHSDQAYQLATEHGIPLWIAVAQTVQGWVAMQRGQLERAADYLEEALDMGDKMGAEMFTIIAIGDLIKAYSRLGWDKEAERTLARAENMLKSRLLGFLGPEILRIGGELWHRRGDIARAESYFSRAMDRARACSMRAIELRIALSWGRLWAEQGRFAEAGELVRDVRAWFREGGDTEDLRETRVFIDQCHQQQHRQQRRKRDTLGRGDAEPPTSANQLSGPAPGLTSNMASNLPPELAAVGEYVFDRLERELDDSLSYHCLAHTRDDVVPAAQRLANDHGLSQNDTRLLLTAALFHDLGFIEKAEGHEEISVGIARQVLPGFGYRADEIAVIVGMIRATKIPQSPKTELEQLMADADLDVLGRKDFFGKNDALLAELRASGMTIDREQWYTQQVRFLERHSYFTDTAKALRDQGKRANLAAVRRRRQELLSPAGET